MKIVTLGGRNTLEQVAAVARYGAVVEFSAKYIERVKICRQHVERFSREGKAIYGITTGLGDNCRKFIPEEERVKIQRNHILAHTVSVGEPLDEEGVRAMMFVMLLHFGSGLTGFRLETLELIKELLNRKITPRVPKHGSVGYIGLESHIGMVLIGEGQAWYEGELLPGAEALKRAGLQPAVLGSKEGLTLVSGTTSVTALACLAYYDSVILSGTADVSGAFSLEMLKGTLKAMDESLKVIDYIKNAAEYVKTKDGSISASQMLERFLFPSHIQYTAISKLSGGEKRRLYLLRILMEAPNVILLDEPTNDLDIQTLTILEDYLDTFPGIVITVSHDRYFLDRVVNRIFAFEGQGRVTQYEGGFTDYQRTAKAGESQAGNRADTGETLTAGGAANTPEAQDGNQAVKRNNWKEGQNVTRKLKLSFKEQRDWETIEEDIAGLEAAVEELEKEIIRSSSNYTRLNELMAEKDAKEKELEEKMERWMYLNELMEQIEAQK